MSTGAAVVQIGAEPDREEAARYIAALAGSADAVVTFQTFDDLKNRKDWKLARILHGTLTEHLAQLRHLNAQGAGVYVMVNEGDGNGRGEENVTALRAVFVDDDKGQLDPATLAVPPSTVVRSSPGKLHAYWNLRPGEPRDAFTPTQEALATKLGTDRIIDLPRVLRVPGFYHRKDPAHPFLVELVSTSTATYSIAEVRAGFQLDQVKKPEAPRPASTPATTGRMESAFDRYNRERYSGWPASGSGTCPDCGDAGAWGLIPDSDPPTWSCFNPDPHRIGKWDPAKACWKGRQVDLDADMAGMTPLDLLHREGFWQRAATLPRAAPAPEAPSEETTAADPGHARRKLLSDSILIFTPDDLTSPPPVQQFILYPYIPAGTVTTLAGPGGSSKTTLLTYLAVCRALGIPFFGQALPTRGRTAIFTTEDGKNDYHRKLSALRHELGDLFDPEAVSRNVALFDLPGVPVRLVESNRGNFCPTALADDLAAVVVERLPGTDLIIMETVSRLAGGMETNESLSILVEAAQRLCKLARCAVLLVAHVSQEAGRQGFTDAYTARGGSALGDNGRSTIILTGLNENNRKLYAPDADLKKEDFKRLLVLAHPKCNYAPTADPILLQRVQTPFGPVLSPATLRAKNVDPAEQANRLREVIATLTTKGSRRPRRSSAGTRRRLASPRRSSPGYWTRPLPKASSGSPRRRARAAATPSRWSGEPAREVARDRRGQFAAPRPPNLLSRRGCRPPPRRVGRTFRREACATLLLWLASSYSCPGCATHRCATSLRHFSRGDTMTDYADPFDDPRTWSRLGDGTPEGFRTYRIRSITPAPPGAVSVFVWEEEITVAPVKYLALCDVAWIETNGRHETVVEVDRQVLSQSFSPDSSDDPDRASTCFLATAPTEAIGREWATEAITRRKKFAANEAARKAATP